MAVLHHLALLCNFPDLLRDRLVCGVNHTQVACRAYDRAYSLAEMTEAAEQKKLAKKDQDSVPHAAVPIQSLARLLSGCSGCHLFQQGVLLPVSRSICTLLLSAIMICRSCKKKGQRCVNPSLSRTDHLLRIIPRPSATWSVLTGRTVLFRRGV